MTWGEDSDSFGSDLAVFARAPATPAPTPPFAGNERYAVVRVIGEGSFGIVYEARDRVRDRAVALKVLRRVDPRWLYRFKREFRSLAGVREPHLVALHELSASDDHVFFAMDFVPGGPLSRERARGDVAALFGQLARGLFTLHGLGVLHRDVKPSNVLVDDAGHVVIVDFGLAIEATDGTSTVVAGTPRYMAPELFRGGAASRASDWYAFGVMLYEALTGEQVDPKAPGPPAAVHTIAAGADASLAALADRLVQLDPAARPSGEEVLAVFGAEAEAPASTVATGPRFIGREPELETLRRAWDAVHEGGTRLVLFEGESGIGKSALLAEFMAEVKRDPRALVLSHRCAPEEHVPYNAFDGIVDQLSRELAELPRADAEGVSPRDGAALTRLFPVLGGIDALGHGRVPDGIDLPELRRRGIAAMRELFVRLGDRRPVFLAVDDLHWADADSADMLVRLLRAPDSPSLMAVGFTRPGDSVFAEALAQREGAWLRGVGFERHAIGPLDAVQAAALAAEVAEGPCALDEADGNPGLVIELARAGAHGEAGLDAAWAERLEGLSPAARRLLDDAALVAEEIPTAVATDLGGGDAVEELTRARLLRRLSDPTRDALRWSQPRHRERLRSKLGEARDAHRRLADAFARADPEAHERIAIHLEAAGDRDGARKRLTAAGDRALASGAHRLAASAYERALNLVEPARRGTAEGRDLTQKVAESLLLEGFNRRAADAFLTLSRHAPAEDAFAYRVRAMRYLLVVGYLDEGLELLEELLDEVGLAHVLRKSRAAVGATFGLSVARMRARGYRVAVRSPETVLPLERRRLDVLMAAADGAGGVHMATLFPVVVELLGRALRYGDAHRAASALSNYGALLGVLGVRHEAHRVLGALHHLHVETGDGEIADAEARARGWLAIGRGAWREGARVIAAHGKRPGEIHSWGFRLGSARFNADYWTGEVAGAARELPAAMDLARERGDRLGHFWLSMIRSWVLCAHDRPDEAIAVIDRAALDWPPNHRTVQQAWANNNRGHVELYRGDAAAARASFNVDVTASLMKSYYVHTPDSAIQLGATIARLALVEYPRAGWARRRVLARHLEQGVTHMEKAKDNWGIAWARALRGAYALHRGDGVGAEELLADAEPMLAGVQMHHVLAAVRQARARLLRGHQGRLLQEKVDAYVKEQGIVNPDAFFRMMLVVPS